MKYKGHGRRSKFKDNRSRNDKDNEEVKKTPEAILMELHHEVDTGREEESCTVE